MAETLTRVLGGWVKGAPRRADDRPMCTRIFWNDNPIAKVVSRTIDWEVSDEPGMWVLPRGLRRGGDQHLPGDIISTDRFVRAKHFLKHLPEPANELEAVASVVGLARNVSIPFGAPDNLFPSYPTWWLSAADLTNRVYGFQLTRSPNFIWLDLRELDVSEGAGVRMLDPTDVTLVGDVRDRLRPAELPFGLPATAAA